MMIAQSISRRQLLGGLAAGSVLTVLGCSSATEEPTSTASPGPGSEEIVGNSNVTVYAWTNGPVIDDNFSKSVDMFNEEFSGKFSADINFLPYDQYWQKIQLQYASNQPFDMYYWDVQAYAHYKADLLQSNQAAIEAAGLEKTDEYPAALWDPWRFDGSDLYGIPENLQSVVFFYNKTHFDEAGLEYPNPDWTWEKVAETAPLLTQKDGDKVIRWGLDIGTLGVWWGAQALSWAAGSAFFDKPLEPTKFQMTDPENVEILRFIQDLMWENHIAPRPDERAAAGEAGGFASGQYSMMADGTWAMSGFKDMTDEWDMTSLPLWKGESVAPYFLGGWVIPAKSSAISAAEAFATWRATTFQAQMAKDNDWIPILNSARESSDMLASLPAGFKEALDGIADARIGDLYHSNSQQMLNEVFFPLWDQLTRDQLTPEDAASKIQEQASAFL